MSTKGRSHLRELAALIDYSLSKGLQIESSVVRELSTFRFTSNSITQGDIINSALFGKIIALESGQNSDILFALSDEFYLHKQKISSCQVL